MSYDKSVWTDEKPDPRKWYWFDDEPEVGSAPILDCRANMPSKDYVRSVHAIPSAEEIAALVECEKALDSSRVALTYAIEALRGGLADGNREYLVTVLVGDEQAARAALARLDAVRKERGA